MPGLSVLKTVTVCILAMSILAAAPAYAGDKGAEHDGKMPGKMKVVTSFTIIDDMARNVAGEAAVV